MNHYGTNGNDLLYLDGNASGDRTFALAGDDYIVWSPGSVTGKNQWVDGGSGIDTLVIPENAFGKPGNLADCVNVEREFVYDTNGDGIAHYVALDTLPGQHAGDAYRIYEAAFNRTPDAAGLDYWIGQMDAGMGLLEVAARFIDSPEFSGLYGVNPSHEQYVYSLYSNVLDRAPDPAGANWWVNQMNTNPEKTEAKVLADFTNSFENVQNFVAETGGVIQYDLWMG